MANLRRVPYNFIGKMETRGDDVKYLQCTVSAAYTEELGTGHFLRYKRKSALTGDFYFKNRFWGFKNLRYKRKSGFSDYGLSTYLNLKLDPRFHDIDNRLVPMSEFRGKKDKKTSMMK